MTNYTDYTAYFRQLAIDFLGDSDTEKHFYRKGLEEFLQGLQTVVNYPAMLLDRYDYKYSDNGADNVMKDRTIAFMIIDNAVDIEDYNRIDEIFDFTENIVDQIFNRVREDMHYPKHDFMKYANMNNVQVSPIENYADATYGYFVTIDISSHHNTIV